MNNRELIKCIVAMENEIKKEEVKCPVCKAIQPTKWPCGYCPGLPVEEKKND